MLYIVATPIGNLEDITLRAIRILKEVDFVIAEDTRKTGQLLKHLKIDKPLKSFHGYSSKNKSNLLAEELVEGKSAALVSDAGTPGISDPGFMLIQSAIDAGVEITPIPGPSAVITALQASGAPIDKFVFLGFIPVKKGRQTLLKTLPEYDKTLVIYESVHRIGKTLNELYTTLGDRYVCVGREMTKMYEEYFRGTLSEASKKFASKSKGEFTIVIAPEGFKKD
jgi:16S rRNA (cytidine1402-2'-O)-methyltransferase